MKKFFAIAAIAGVLVACGNNAENGASADSTGLTVDTATVTPDTASMGATMDTAAGAMGMDTATTGTTTTDSASAQ